MYSWEHRHPFPHPPHAPPPPPPPHHHPRRRARAHTHTHTRARALFSMPTGWEPPTKDADVMVPMCSRILQSRDRLWWEVGRSSGLASLCTASSLMQAWSCRRGVNGGDSGAGCFPGPKLSLFLLCLPNLPECSTRPAPNASFPRYCLQVLPDREKGIAKHHRGGSC